MGYALARRGHDVLFVEKGRYLLGEAERGDGWMRDTDDPEERLAQGWWPQKLQGETSYASLLQMYFPLGCGTGGSSALYAAQLERMQPSDFEPKKHYPDATGASVVESWPYPYESLLPYYREAEALFHVCGTPDPLNPDPLQKLREPPPMSERDRYLFGQMAAGGMHPYRAHVGCKYLPGCTGCGAALCPRRCKGESGTCCVEPAVQRHGASVLANAEAVRFSTDGERVTSLVVNSSGEQAEIRGDQFILAAGALMSPALLLRSDGERWPRGLGNRSGQVGRNLMFHSADIVAVRPPKRLDPTGPAKAISAGDLYVREGKKLGTWQSMGIPVFAAGIEAFLKGQAQRNPKWYLTAAGKLGRRLASRIGAKLFASANVFSTMVEDLPYPNNRIIRDDDAPGGLRFRYIYPDELRQRNDLYRTELRKLLPRQLRVIYLTDENNLNFGHTSGTLRSGLDPETSVVGADHRVHDLENLYVADASTFPASGGINPSLTVAATALMVAEQIDARVARTGLQRVAG